MTSVNPEDKYERIRLKNQLCFPLYACAKEVLRQYREPLDKLGLTYTQYAKEDERILFISLTEAGEALKEEAVNIPDSMKGCIDLSDEELWELKTLLDKALIKIRRIKE